MIDILDLGPLPDLRWWDRGQYGIWLTDVRALKEPVPCLGSLAMPWTVPPDIERQVREQLTSLEKP